MLFREAGIYERDKEKLNRFHPYDRATKLCISLKGLEEDYLDTIRKRICEIGNTLGFVRMNKNGSFKGKQNLPEFFDDFKFEDLAENL